MSRTASLEGQDAEREAFDHALAPCFPELLQAAQREVRHRLALGQFEPDHPTPEQLLDVALQHAWAERRRSSPPLGIKALALVSIFRAGEGLGTREAERRRMTTELFPEEVEPDPFYQKDDEEDFWQSHELDYPRDAEVFSGTVDRVGAEAANDDELVGWLAPREREVLLMHEVHGVELRRSPWHSRFRWLKRSDSSQARATAYAPRADRARGIRTFRAHLGQRASALTVHASWAEAREQRPNYWCFQLCKPVTQPTHCDTIEACPDLAGENELFALIEFRRTSSRGAAESAS